MIKHSKRTLSFCLAVALIVGMVVLPPVSAEEIAFQPAVKYRDDNSSDILLCSEDFSETEGHDDEWYSPYVTYDGESATVQATGSSTSTMLTYNVAEAANWTDYVVEADISLGERTFSSDYLDAYFTVAVGTTSPDSWKGIECAVYYDDNSTPSSAGWKSRVHRRERTIDNVSYAAKTVGAAAWIPNPVADEIDFNKTFHVKVSFFGLHVVFEVNGYILQDVENVMTETEFTGDHIPGSFAFCSQQGNPMSIDNVIVYKPSKTDRKLLDFKPNMYANATALNAIYTMQQPTSGEYISYTECETDYFYTAHNAGARNAALGTATTLNNGKFANTLRFAQGALIYNPEAALSWKNYSVSVDMMLTPKSGKEPDTIYTSAKSMFGIGFALNATDKDRKNVTFNNRVLFAYDNSKNQYYYRLYIAAGLVSEGYIDTVFTAYNERFINVRLELFGNVVKLYVDDEFIVSASASSTLTGTFSIFEVDTSTYTFAKNLVVYGDVPAEEPQLPENTVFYENFDDYSSGQMTETKSSSRFLFDYTRKTARVLTEKNVNKTFLLSQGSAAKSWVNKTYSVDMSFDWLPKDSKEMGRSDTAAGTAYWGFNLINTVDTTLEVTITYQPESKAWGYRLFRRNNNNGTAAAINQNATTLPDSAVTKFNRGEFVNVKLVTYGNLIFFYVDGVEIPITKEFDPDPENKPFVPGGTLALTTTGNSSAGVVFDNVLITETPKPANRVAAFDFNNDYEVDEAPITKANGWYADVNNNRIVELEDNSKALLANNNISWNTPIKDGSVTVEFSVETKIENDTDKYSNTDFFPRMQLGNWGARAIGLRMNFTNLTRNDQPVFEGLYDMRTLSEQCKADGTDNPNNYLLAYFNIEKQDFEFGKKHTFKISKMGNFVSTAIDGIVTSENVILPDDYSSCLDAKLDFSFCVDTTNNNTYIHKIEITECYGINTYTVDGGDDFSGYEYKSAAFLGKPNDIPAGYGVRNIYAAGDTVAITANEGVKIKAGSLKYVDENTNTGNIFLSANGKLGDGRSFIFTMPDCDVTSIEYTSMEDDTLSFAVIAASRSLTDDTELPHAVRFLHRVYLGGRKGNGYSSSVVYNDINYTITDIGAAIVPDFAFDGEFNEVSLFNPDNRIMMVSLFDHGKLYDSTDEYIDFTLRMTGIPDDSRVYRCCTYVKLKDGEGNEIYVCGNVREESFNSLE